MSWGTGSWGAGSPWGTGTAAPPPTLSGVASYPGPTAPPSSPAVVAVRGGTILRVLGTNFVADEDRPYIEVDFLNGALEIVGQGYIFDPEFDIQASHITCGAPALEAGLYSLRVTTAGGTSGILADAVAARLFAEEFKTHDVRRKWGPKWDTGDRLLRR